LPSRRLVVSLSCRLVVLSSRCLAVSSSCHLVVPPSRCIVTPAGCRIISHCRSLCRPLVLSSCRLVVALPHLVHFSSSHCAPAIIRLAIALP
jgi:hypothetical protein